MTGVPGDADVTPHDAGERPDAPTARRWFTAGPDGQPLGPWTLAQLSQSVVDGSLSARSPVCPEGSQQWVAAGMDPALRFIVPTPATEDDGIGVLVPVNTTPMAIVVSYLALVVIIPQAIAGVAASEATGSELAGAAAASVVGGLVLAFSVFAWRMNRKAVAEAKAAGRRVPRGAGRIIFAIAFSGLCTIGALVVTVAAAVG